MASDAPPPVEAPADPPPDAPTDAPDKPEKPEKEPREPAHLLHTGLYGGAGAYAGAGRGAGMLFGYHHAAGSPKIAFLAGGSFATTGKADRLLSLEPEPDPFDPDAEVSVPGVLLMPDLGVRVELRPNAMVSPTFVVGGGPALIIPFALAPVGYSGAGSTFHLSPAFVVDSLAITRIMRVGGRTSYFVTAEGGIRF